MIINKPAVCAAILFSISAASSYGEWLQESEFDLAEFNEFSVPVVLTATRIQQHQADVPASVTILDRSFIERSGVQTLSELLRFVPGMIVGPDRNNNTDSVQYHGGPTALPKNLQVLLNGRSMYRSGLAAVSWYEMPVSLNDIRRIEVVRGPNAATYGANSYQAVINIITRHPADTYGQTAEVQLGNNGDKTLYVSQGDRIHKTDYRFTYEYKQTDQFQVDEDERENQFIDFTTSTYLKNNAELQTYTVVSQGNRELTTNDTLVTLQQNENQVDENRYEFGMSYTQDLSSKHQIKLTSYATYYQQEQEYVLEGIPIALLDDDIRALYTDNKNLVEGSGTSAKGFEEAIETENPALIAGYYSSLSNEEKTNVGFLNMFLVGQFPGGESLLSDYTSRLSAPYQASVAAIVDRYENDPQTSPFDTTVAGTVFADLDEYRYDIELQDTYIVNDDLTLVGGASFRRDIVESDHYFSGRFTNDTYRLFSSATWQATESTITHFGLMAEKESDADAVFAPRLAVIEKLNPAQSVRFVYSESVRSPDLFEQYANWNFEVRNAESDGQLNGTTYYETSQGPGRLDHQHIASTEIGYYGRYQKLDAEIDVRLFHERLTDVIYQSLSLGDFETTTSNRIEFNGIEMQSTFVPWQDGQLRTVAAYIDAETNQDDNEDARRLLRIYAQHQVAVTWLQTWQHNINSAVSYLRTWDYDQLNEAPADRTELERIDARIAKRWVQSDWDVELSLTAQHDLTSDAYVWPQTVYQDRTRAQLGLQVGW